MHPAPSLVAFTTLSGAGYGLLVILSLAAGVGWVVPTRALGLAGLGLALLLITAGLGASTLHLRHPERAWRAFSQWRSSWLSREGIAALATFLPAIALVVTWVGYAQVPWPLVLAALVGAVATLICTGQIYASLKPIARWHHPLTTPCYLALALATGASGALMVALVASSADAWLALLPVLLLPAAWALKLVWWRRTDRGRSPATPESATALGNFGKVRMLEPPHTETNYLLNEMGFRLARKHSVKLRRIAILAGFIAPWLMSLGVLGLGRGVPASILAVLAFVVTLAGTLVERWLFFAEARHTVMLYYGAPSA